MEYIYNVGDVSLVSPKYIISIGRRQPMHIGHIMGIKRILSIENAKLIYVIGSMNLFGDLLFDPINNPLNLEQQIQQFKLVFPKENPIFIALKDFPDTLLWASTLIKLLQDINISSDECVIHFIGKKEDVLQTKKYWYVDGKEILLLPNQWEIEIFKYFGFRIWMDSLQYIVKDSADLCISARNFRGIDLYNLSQSDKRLLATPDYLKKIALKARYFNTAIYRGVDTERFLSSERLALEEFGHIRRAITLYDLSIQRIITGSFPELV